MKKIITHIALLLCLGWAGQLQAQDSSSRLNFITSAGILVPLSSFANAYQSSLALGTGVEYVLGKRSFLQLTADINAVTYNQQVKDGTSAYLFQSTKSAVLLGGINYGLNIWLNPSKKLFTSPYVGAGYLNIGEPRLSLNTANNTINQTVNRKGGIFGRGGIRIGYKTASKILQTLYVDASYWRSPITIQNSQPQALSISIATRFGF